MLTCIRHHLFTLVLQDRLYLAPMTQPRHVLDIGTGIGLWARYIVSQPLTSFNSKKLTYYSNISDAHPKAQILGSDLSPLWHSDFTIRPNLTFEVDDCCSNWTYLDEGSELFDLIHIRCLYGSVKDWRRLYQQAFEHLEPGRGWIEQVEVSFVPRFWYTQGEGGGAFCRLEEEHMGWDSTTVHLDKWDSSTSIFVTWYNFWKECSQRTGKTWFVADQMASLIYEAGFENVCQMRYMLPLFDCSEEIAPTTNASSICGGYSDYPVARLAEIARWFRQFWETGMEGWVLAVSTRYMGVCLSPKLFRLREKQHYVMGC